MYLDQVDVEYHDDTELNNDIELHDDTEYQNEDDNIICDIVELPNPSNEISY